MATRTVDLGSVVGPQGPSGPNEITSATETNLTGFLYGDGSNVGVRAISNRNLLDNGWFTVNQRGVADATTVSGNGFFADRWQATGNGVQRVAGGGISVLGTAYHKLDNPGISGKTVTLSILYYDGEISSNTFAWTGTSFSKTFKYGTVNIYPSANQINIEAQSVNVKAVKLELGSVSTLANDAPPNFAEELAKCQRYFWNPGFSTNILGFFSSVAGIAGHSFSILVSTPVPMRAVTPTINATVHWVRGNGSQITGYTLNTSGATITNGFVCGIALDKTSGYTPLQMYLAAFSSLTVSCDL